MAVNMKVSDIMTEEPAFCTPETELPEVAMMMRENDCGEIPVVESREKPVPIGVVTDRDIAIRSVAEGKDPQGMSAADCMSTPCVTVGPEMRIDEACGIMEENQIRRVPVIDRQGKLCGILALADIARYAPGHETAEVVSQVSQPVH